jgi:hypothetical protein
MNEIFTGISIILLTISEILHGIVNRMQRKEINNLAVELKNLRIKTNDMKTEMYIKYKELENWVK